MAAAAISVSVNIGAPNFKASKVLSHTFSLNSKSSWIWKSPEVWISLSKTFNSMRLKLFLVNLDLINLILSKKIGWSLIIQVKI